MRTKLLVPAALAVAIGLSSWIAGAATPNTDAAPVATIVRQLADLLDEDPLSEGYDVPALTEYGLDGWEVVDIIARNMQPPTGRAGDNMSGVYFLLKRELTSADSVDLA